MEPPHPVVCIATLGGQPQVVTLALDALLAQGVPITDVIVVHLSTHTPRNRAAVACLAREFATEHYQGHPCRYRAVPVRLGRQMVADLDSTEATDAARNTFHHLIQQLKQQDATMHLCVSGGRRLLGMLALSAALLNFDHTDRIWHLYSSEAVRRQTEGGAVLHLPDHPEVHLVRVPVPPWGHLFPAVRLPAHDATTTLDLQTRMLDATERACCQRVANRLTRRQGEVLRAFARGLTPQEVANELGITLAAVDAHKTPIFQECRNEWNLLPDFRLDYRWLRDKFAPFFAV